MDITSAILYFTTIFQHIFTRTVVQTRFVPRQFKLFFSSTFERFPEYIYIYI